MKTLRKGKKYAKVSPLPKGWHGIKGVTKETESKGQYRKSFRQLKKLLDDGWQYCPREEYRKSLKACSSSQKSR
tara:strand:+ start:300 stop:521 length:222 start_codon:yes stop_codon:yes gene_type:complete